MTLRIKVVTPAQQTGGQAVAAFQEGVGWFSVFFPFYVLRGYGWDEIKMLTLFIRNNIKIIE